MKHGRRHDSLKEKVYRERAAQGARGYKTPHEPIDVREPDEGVELREPTAPLADRVKGRTKRGLRRLGVSTDEPREGE